MFTMQRGQRIRKAGPGGNSPNGLLEIKAGKEVSLLVQGLNVYLKNTGSSVIYMSIDPNVTKDMWELEPGNVEGPFSTDESLHFTSSGSTNLKYIFVEE